MNPRINLIDQRFGHLRVTAYAGKAPNGTSLWHCHCDACGTDKIMSYSTLTWPKGRTKSCGCQRGRKAKTV